MDEIFIKGRHTGSTAATGVGVDLAVAIFLAGLEARRERQGVEGFEATCAGGGEGENTHEEKVTKIHNDSFMLKRLLRGFARGPFGSISDNRFHHPRHAA